jgi:hypothetical protein
MIRGIPSLPVTGLVAEKAPQPYPENDSYNTRAHPLTHLDDIIAEAAPSLRPINGVGP